jgi:hypothetical protein
MNRKMRRAQSVLSREWPSPFLPIRMDEVLWEFAQRYHKLHSVARPHLNASVGLVTVSMLMMYEEFGSAVRYTAPDGSTTWRASAKFLRETGLEPGGLVTMGPPRPSTDR